MAKQNKTVGISFTVTEEEAELFTQLDEVLLESRAEWLRKNVLRAVRKHIKKVK